MTSTFLCAEEHDQMMKCTCLFLPKTLQRNLRSALRRVDVGKKSVAHIQRVGRGEMYLGVGVWGVGYHRRACSWS